MTVGRLCWKPLRDYLRKEQFMGHDVKWVESSGWLEREFTISAPAVVFAALEKWSKSTYEIV
jgi:hypothetical protein